MNDRERSSSLAEETGEKHIPGPLIEALRLGRVVAVEVQASIPERLAGVTIFPQRCTKDGQAQTEGWQASIPDRSFRVFWREYSRQHLENGWDLAPGDGIWELKGTEVVGEQALELLLLGWGISLTALTYVWKTEIPE
jgi:hypothetical protein